MKNTNWAKQYIEMKNEIEQREIREPKKIRILTRLSERPGWENSNSSENVATMIGKKTETDKFLVA